MQGHRIIAPTLLALWACGEEPVRPTVAHHVAPPTMISSATVCDKYWTIAASGDWNDPMRWSPSGVPGLADDVCFAAAGSYAVALDNTETRVGDLDIQNGVNVTFDGQQSPLTSTGRDLILYGALTIDRTARISTAGCAALQPVSYATIVDGNLTLRDPCTTAHSFASLDIGGILELEDAEVWLDDPGTAFVKRGDMSLAGESSIILAPWLGYPSFARLEGGSVLGNGIVRFLGPPLGPPGTTVTWTGGSLPARAAMYASAQVLLQNVHLHLSGPSLPGAVDVVCDASNTVHVRGVVRSATDVGLLPSTASTTCELQSATVNPPFTPISILGRVLLRAPSFTTLNVLSNAPIENSGTLTTIGAGDVDLNIQQLVNRGTLSVQSRVQFGISASSLLQNLGLVSVGTSPVQLSIKQGTFDAAAGSRMLGRLKLASGTRLTGTGQVGVVTSVGGTIAPGPTLGALTIDALTLDAGSRVTLDIVDTAPGRYDRLIINGPASYAGTLEATPLGPFLPGSCGQVIPVITDRTARTGLPRGSFMQFAGTPSGQPRAWRAHYPADSVLLVGFDPTVDVALASTPLVLAEGGPGVSANVCLGNHAPASKVDVTHVALGNQFTAAPSTLAFLPSNWALPQRLTFAAIDDAVGEGPHTDYVRRRIASGDPFYSGLTVADVPVTIADNDPGADLTVAFLVGQTATVGGRFDVRFRVTNNGPAASTGSTFTITPLSGATFANVFTSGVTCAPASGILTCTIGALAAGASADLSFDFDATTAGVHVNTARITGLGYDHVAGNNSATWTLTVNP